MLSKYYNVRVIDYGDSTQLRIYNKPVVRGCQDKIVDDDSVEFDVSTEILEKRHNHSVISTMNRTKNKIYSVSRANEWELFVTFTFDPLKVDRTDYDLCSSKVREYLHYIRRKYAPDLKYICVPELHNDGISWHVHALLADIGSLKLIDSGIVKSGKCIYNIDSWKWGFSTASYIESSERVSSYICKYITKDLVTLTLHRKRYWSSANCNRFEDCVSDYFVDDPFSIFNCYGGDVEYISSVECPNGARRVTYVEINNVLKN